MTIDLSALHESVAELLAAGNQRYGEGRRSIIEALATAGRPLSAPEIDEALGGAIPYSSLYRNLVQLSQAQVVKRILTTDEQGRFELSETVLGSHHHHFTCLECGKVTDLEASNRLEKALREATQAAEDDFGLEVTEHRIDLFGYCKKCKNHSH